MINCTFEDGNQTSELRHVTAGCMVLQSNSILLAKRSERLIEGGKWCLLGGYIQRDETVAEGVTREVKEESGWDIENIRLLRVNDSPLRPHEDRQNVDFIFVADATEQTSEPDWETAELKWFSFDNLPAEDEIAFDHSDAIRLLTDHIPSNTEIIYGTI